MPFDFVLAGPIGAIESVIEAAGDWPNYNLCGVVLVGAGECPAHLIARTARWEDLDFSSLPTPVVVLAEAPSQVVARALVRKAVDQGKSLRLIDGCAPRRLRMDDLIGRPIGTVNWSRVSATITGKRVLITGGGGSIGSELARRVAGLAPRSLALLDASEFNLHRMTLELRDAVPILADIRDAQAVRRWFDRERPDLVFHAAALKQVPMVEAFPSEGVLTNVCGLRNVAEAAHAVGADLVFVSTDKAVDPTGVMGATKRLGELYCRALDQRGPSRAISVRLGNVLGSAGSVAPLFEEQIRAGGPVTVTDPQVTRYFMSIPQSAKALLQSAAAGLSDPSARGSVYAVDMGEAIPVVELARDMIRLAGLRPHEDIQISFTGLRPGERLHEFFIGSDEWRAPDPVEGVIAVTMHQRGLADLEECMDRLAHLARHGAHREVAAQLFAALAPQAPTAATKVAAR